MQTEVQEIQRLFDHELDVNRPATLVSLFMEDCIEKAKGYYNGDTRYTFRAPHAGGMPDVCNSLLVLKKAVFEDSLISLKRFVNVLRDNWNGAEELKGRMRKSYRFYGNDDPESDEMMQRLFDDYTDCVGYIPFRNGIHRPAGISTFGRKVPWLEHRMAVFHGFGKGDILATNFSPTPGTDNRGPTAALKSYCKVDFDKLPNGATLELKMHPSCVDGGAGKRALVALYKSFIALGGFYLTIDVIDTEVLKNAQKNPERYPNLAVRVAGWCTRFTTLHKKWQDMIIQRTQQYF